MEMPVKIEKTTGNPGPLGLFSFALSTWLLALINAGEYSISNIGLVLAMGIAFGGTVQFIVGLLCYFKGDTFGFTAFGGFGAFWWSFVLSQMFFTKGVTDNFTGWYLLVWGAFTCGLFAMSLNKDRVLQATLIFVILTLFSLAAGNFGAGTTFLHLGGWLGLISGILAFYLGGAQMINENYGRTIFPIGEYKPKE
ncbi:acetate uptake transporter [Actinobacillus delphinicola]|uniref:Inner membrane protein n=1 Tax=Actinobacillus delphinicola TaxID=51161 RepID=A0A448TRV8_9PAST|nr:acetate uptake transporter [Actinobacillus delphinicola]VEJ08757.1 inner membrane protein [Actinobacillus delphinicola]